MKRMIPGLLGMLVVVAATALAQDELPQGQAARPPESLEERASYGIGMSIGQNLRAQQLDLNVQLLLRGLEDALTGRQPLLSEEEVAAALQQFEQQMLARISERNLQVSEEFLAENRAREGVVTLPSGLQYEVLEEGTGTESPGPQDQVRVHYHGTLTDGTVFDSSMQGEPVTLPLDGVIDGWSEALTRMTVGDRWRLFIPPNLGYEDTPPPGTLIQPQVVLVFDVELLEIVR